MAQLHLCYLTQQYVPKNELHKTIQVYFKNLDRTIINDAVGFMGKVVQDVNSISASRKTCSPVMASWFNSDGIDYKIAFKGPDNRDLTILSFTILEVKP